MSAEFVGAIDQGTSSTRFILFDRRGGATLGPRLVFEAVLVLGEARVESHHRRRRESVCATAPFTTARHAHASLSVGVGVRELNDHGWLAK